MDLSKLSPARWLGPSEHTFGDGLVVREDADRTIVAVCEDEDLRVAADINTGNAEFIALARNAFAVMMERRWYAYPERGQNDCWGVSWDFVNVVDTDAKAFPWWDYEKEFGRKAKWPNPYTALVEADKWMKEQEAKR